MTTLIMNGLVYNGGGERPLKTNILIKNTLIARIGDFSRPRVDETLDASGTYVMPGFVDVDILSDDAPQSIFEHSTQERLVRQGITTVIGGGESVSLAPVLSRFVKKMWEWHSVADVLKSIERRGCTVNFGTLVGYATMRYGIVGSVSRDITDGELETLENLLRKEFQSGAFGLSAEYGFPHARPSPFHEAPALLKVVAEARRIYAPRFRCSGEDILSDLSEILSLAIQTGVNTEINNFQPCLPYGDRYGEAARRMLEESGRTNIHFDLGPCESVRLDGLELLPQWLRQHDVQEILDSLEQTAVCERVLAHFKKHTHDDLVVDRVHDPSLSFLVGKQVRSIAAIRGESLEKTLFELLQLARARISFLSKSVDRDMTEKLLTHQNAIISSGDGASQGSFLKRVVDRVAAPLEKEIAKATSLPAQKYRIEKRGALKEGYHADIVIMRDFEPTHVLVNGSFALRDGIPQNVFAGKALRCR